jgi:hypothetical protein
MHAAESEFKPVRGQMRISGSSMVWWGERPREPNAQRFEIDSGSRGRSPHQSQSNRHTTKRLLYFAVALDIFTA